MQHYDFDALVKKTSEIGYVEELKGSLIFASGLPKVCIGELVYFESGSLGQITALSEGKVEILLLDRKKMQVGIRIARTGKFMEVTVGQGLLGRTVTPLCDPIDSGGEVQTKNSSTRPVEVVPGGISTRTRINQVMETGVALIDILVPLGKGQRELVVGDRKTGKTSFLLQTVVNQARSGTICIYAAIGKKIIDIKETQQYFVSQGVMNNVIIVASGSSDSPGLIFLTPYTAMTMAEHFRDIGLDSLVVLDDLTTHAKFYREVSLVGGRFPGRESYPGDIFYLHSRLVERAGNFKTPHGDKAISCLPVAESLEGDISGYVQTNLMSMTDGHIFFDNDMFVKGKRPAINPFLSVTRVGNQTQTQIRKDMRREISVVLGLYERSQELSHFGSSLQENAKLSLATGGKIWQFFAQETTFLLPENVQSILFALLWLNYWTQDRPEKMKQDSLVFLKRYRQEKELREHVDGIISSGKDFNDFLGKVGQNMELLKSYLKA